MADGHPMIAERLGLALAPGYELYLPEDFYFVLPHQPTMTREQVQAREAMLRRAVYAMARHVVRWADSYRAYLMFRQDLPEQEKKRAGALPQKLSAREAVIDELFAWLDRNEARIWLVEFELTERDHIRYQQHDEVPGMLILKENQFAELQAAWERAGLPRDLYYPERLARHVVEPVRVHGGIVRAPRLYSPLRWALRNPDALLQVPDEEERIGRFARASREYIEAILLRIAELREPGRDVDPQQIEGLAQVLRAINRVVHEEQQPTES